MFTFYLKELKDEEVVAAWSIAQDKLGKALLLTQFKWQCTYKTKMCVCGYVGLLVRLLLVIPDDHIVWICFCDVKLKEVKSRTKP